uniref:Uncharacterized protein n=1 Tax=Cacopsylla melanoneura TaxID=428564 RepID=A0A8D9BGD0_9HEMI
MGSSYTFSFRAFLQCVSNSFSLYSSFLVLFPLSMVTWNGFSFPLFLLCLFHCHYLCPILYLHLVSGLVSNHSHCLLFSLSDGSHDLPEPPEYTHCSQALKLGKNSP